jgi:secreted trypsin-like serine protease
MKNSILYILCSILLFSFSSAGTIDPNIPDKNYLEYGEKFKCVLEIAGSYDDQDTKKFCASAVAIDPRWVLTAAHVVKESKSVFLYSPNRQKIINIDQVICHEDFEEAKFGFADIALCHTESDIGSEFYTVLYENNDELNRVCTISGYGQTGTFLTGINTWDGKRRAGYNQIDEIENDLLICSPSLSGKTKLEFLIGNGDSGGGLWIDGKLAGINSCVISEDKKTDSDYGDSSGHTRISKFISWIKQNSSK